MTTYENPYRRPAQDVTEPNESLEGMTKAELVEEAARRGVDLDRSATKAEILDALGG